MTRFFGTAGFLLAQSNKIHFVWCGAILLIMLVLALLHHRWRYNEKRLKLWKELCPIPFIVTTVHYFIYTAGAPDFFRNYTPMYLLALAAMLPMFFAEADTGYKAASAVTGVLAAALTFYFCTSSVDLHNYTRKSYTKSFHAMVVQMDKSYVLKEWKEIDFSALEDKYMPMVEEAERQNDPAKFADAVTLFCSELHDGHIRIYADYDDEKYSSSLELAEHGLAMIELASGEVIAICTDPAVNALGIYDGTVITKWNGEPVSQGAERLAVSEMQPVIGNARRVAAAELAATGGDTAEVTFIDETGSEQTVTLTALEGEHTLEDAYKAFTRCPDSPGELYSSNLDTIMLDDKCGYLVLSAESTGSEPRDKLGFFLGRNSKAKELFRNRLQKLKDQGMEYLVVDMRNNMGGYDEIGAALCELLTDEEIYANGLGYRKNGEYIKLCGKSIHGSGEFADLKVAVLVNYECISGGDVTAKYLSKLKNVTVMGITDPNGSGQMTGGCSGRWSTSKTAEYDKNSTRGF